MLSRSLAFAEMRQIPAKVLWNFDLSLAGDCVDWVENMKIYGLWEKKPLMVKLTPAVLNEKQYEDAVTGNILAGDKPLIKSRW